MDTITQLINESVDTILQEIGIDSIDRSSIQSKVEDLLSDSLLAGAFDDCTTIVVDYDEEEDDIVLRRGEGESAEPIEPAEAVPAA